MRWGMARKLVLWNVVKVMIYRANYENGRYGVIK